MKKQAIVLLSGGLDSATAAAVAVDDGFTVSALSFQYGQRNTAEVDAARRVASTLEVFEHRVVPIDLRVFGGSALTDDHRSSQRSRRRSHGRGDSDHLRPGTEHHLLVFRPCVGGGNRLGPISSSGSTRSTTRGTPTVARSTSRRFRPWRVWQPKQGSKDTAYRFMPLSCI